MAGRALRNSGALDDAFVAFSLSLAAWFWRDAPGSVEDRLRVEPNRWRWGLPLRGGGVFVPRVRRLVWSAYDHVIGCGGTIRHRTLDQLQVPREKQQVFEVHHGTVHPPSGKLPRLAGRIAVVDDVHWGQTSQTLALVCDADVVDVGQSLYAGVARILPVCTVEDEAVHEDVGRDR